MTCRNAHLFYLFPSFKIKTEQFTLRNILFLCFYSILFLLSFCFHRFGALRSFIFDFFRAVLLKLHIEPSRAERSLDGGDEFLVSPEAGKGVKDSIVDSIVDSTAVGGDTDPEKKVDFRPAEDGGDKIPLSE